MFSWLVLCVLLAAPAQACGSRHKLVGAPEDVSPDDPELQKAVHFAVTEYNEASNDVFASKVVRILSAEQQIVAGVKYTFEVELGRTQCKQGQVHDLETCNFSETPHKTFCKFEVLSIAWRGETSLQSKMCKPSSN
ncbi:cystatin-like [Hemiscyllium ocellatum]|uniref:cystatin-like n=1 Tax=Hemiscyllium ocellatum TaxID=170820 RepID=UPI002966CBF8|nr:cystatin-like [Hemiscyllium ocellatum]